MRYVYPFSPPAAVDLVHVEHMQVVAHVQRINPAGYLATHPRGGVGSPEREGREPRTQI